MSEYRVESDFLGDVKIPVEALYGVHTYRAMANFPLAQRTINPALIHAFGAVKLGCARANQRLKTWDLEVYKAIEFACLEMMEGKLDSEIKVDALQGGAGTSTNMNVNEVLANRSIQKLGGIAGDYSVLHPIEDMNLHQSTNDTYPTALKVAGITLLKQLEQSVVMLMEACQDREKDFAHIVKIGRTQLQDAVLTTMGRTFSSFADAFGRDRWRIYKCEERLRVVNLGGTAIGTGLSAPRKYIFKATEELKKITGFGLTRAENLVEATQNNDAFVEVSGILKACATNLLKISTDLRLMASGPGAGFAEITLAPKQAGSSIMPGKINPVIPEAVSQAAVQIMSNDNTIAQACAMGNLELNAFMPLIADNFLESIDLQIRACDMLRGCIRELKVNENVCRAHVESSTASITALVEQVGYKAAEKLGQEAFATGKSVKAIAIEYDILTAEEFDQLTSAEAVTRLGS